MKKTLLLTTLFLIMISSSAQEMNILAPAKVDKRVELLSIVARLADYNEYSHTYFKLYVDKIESHFSPYKDHELIEFTRKLKGTNSLGYEAVMTMAIHLDDNLNPRKEFTNQALGPKWNEENAYKFVRLLKSFEKESDFNRFRDSNKSLYSESSERFRVIQSQLDLDWYSKFYGKKPTEKFTVINALGNGGHSYGASFIDKDGVKEVYAIMGAWTVDSKGMVVFDSNNYFPTLLHELNHSYVNHLIDANIAELKKVESAMFTPIKEAMTDMAYASWQIVLSEALVRAAVIKYMVDHNFSQDVITAEVLTQKKKRFYWIKELTVELVKYDKQRDLYPTLESYMPKIIEFYTSYAARIEDAQKKK